MRGLLNDLWDALLRRRRATKAQTTTKEARASGRWREAADQEPRQLDPDISRHMADWFERVAEKEAQEPTFKDEASHVGIAHNRWVKVPGETPQQEEERFEREAQLESDLEREGRRVFTGQVLPVRYDDD